MNKLPVKAIANNSLSFLFGCCFSIAAFPANFLPTAEIDQSISLLTYGVFVSFVLFIKKTLETLLVVVRSRNE